MAFALLCLPELYSAAQTQSAEPIEPVPRSVDVDPRRAALGERLFHDPRLSGRGTDSCATCHPLDTGGMDGLPRARRPSDGALTRNTPTIFNVSLSASFNWDGASGTLEEHTARLIPGLMGLEWQDLLARLRADAGYRAAFDATYAGEITQPRVIDALVTFERTLLTPDAPFDRFLSGATDALSAQAQEGYRLFKDLGCASCHQGVNVGANLYQRFGIFEPPLENVSDDDPGRFAVTRIPRDRGVFRVPSLRNVALTAPYFHDGRAATLDEAVRIMGRRQLGRELSAEDRSAIVAFLESLTGQYRGLVPRASRHRLAPQKHAW